MDMGIMLARLLTNRLAPVWLLAVALAPGGLLLLLLSRVLKRSVEWQ
jgi:hypothetical protein